MLKLNINKENDKYKNLFNQGIEFVYENEDIPTNTVDDTEDNKEPVKEEKKPDKKKKLKPNIKKHRINNNLEHNPLRIISDRQGLEKAYKNNDNNIYMLKVILCMYRVLNMLIV